MYRIVALVGESGCGKDYAASALVEKYPHLFHQVIPDTTRPKRDYEIDGLHYNFITSKKFAEYVLDGTMLEATCFNDNWYYGTNKNSLVENRINLVILNPIGLERIKENTNIKVYSIYIQTFPIGRLMKCLQREGSPNCHEICRRFLADEEMFKNFNGDINIRNNYTEEFIDRLLDKIGEITW